jgi:dihydrolipoamide dehydrogenase
MSSKRKRDLVIVGGGAGGLVVASVAAQLGLKVTLIEREKKLGGDCLHHGCVPSKTLIRSAKVASLMRRAGDFGLPTMMPDIDMGKVNARVQTVVDHIQQHDHPERFRGYGCEVLLGEAAEFVDSSSVRVGNRVIHGRRFVIATGSRPYIPPIAGLEDSACLTNLDIFSLQQLPQRLVVLGGGAVGLEMAQAFSRLGSQVTVIEMLPHLLPQDDPEVSDALRILLEQEGITILTGTSAERVLREDEHRIVECSDGVTIEADRILIAVGRRANVDNLGLAAAGVEYTERGIEVDMRMRSSQKHIYAVGDVCGPYPFTHMAEYQAGIIISNAVFRFPKRADYRVVPRVTYTDPELARVGLTEKQTMEKGIKPMVLRYQFKDVDRALTDNETNGLVKLITHKGRILGASILGPHGGDLLQEIVLAMNTGAKIGDISATIHAYPTLSQANRRAVNTAYAPKLFSAGTRRLVRWINRLLP